MALDVTDEYELYNIGQTYQNHSFTLYLQSKILMFI